MYKDVNYHGFFGITMKYSEDIIIEKYVQTEGFVLFQVSTKKYKKYHCMF